MSLGGTLRRLGALAGLGTMDLVPGVTFQNDDARGDFVNGVQLRGTAGLWPGITPSVMSQLQQAIATAGASLNVEAVTLAEQFKQTAQAYVQQLDQLQHFGLFGRSDQQDLQYRSYMDLLKREILGFLQAYTSLANAQRAPQPAPTSSGTQVAYDQLTSGVSQNVQAILAQNLATQQAVQQAAEPQAPFPWVPVIGGVLILLVGGYVLMGKKGG